jgi:MFS transporter, YNFM family, putative membrane transport protein
MSEIVSARPDPIPASEPPALPPHDLKRVIFVLGACGFASTFTMRILDPLVPTLAAEFGRSIPEVAMISTAFSFSYALGQPVIGAVADTAGKIRTIKISLVILTVLSVLAGLAWSFGSLVALRAMTGVAAGGVIPVAMAAIGDRAPMNERQVALGRFLVLMIFGQMAGATCSGFIAHHVGWRGVMDVAGAIAGVAALITFLTLKPRPGAARPPLSFSTALANYKGVFSNPRAKLLYFLVILEGSLIFGMPPFVAAILGERSGVGPFEAGLVIGGSGLGGLIYGLTVRHLVRIMDPARMTLVGGLVMGAAYVVFALPGLPWWSAIVLFVIQGFGFFLLHGTYQAQATELAPAARGSAMALFACALFLGHALGPVIMGLLITVLGTTGAIIAFAIAIMALGAMTSPVLGLRRS